MLLKLLLRMWPALAPWVVYFLWFFIFKKLLPKIRNRSFFRKSSQNNSFNHGGSDERIIDAEYVSQDESRKNHFNQNSFQNNHNKVSLLNNKHFVVLLYLSLILAIISVISFAF